MTDRLLHFHVRQPAPHAHVTEPCLSINVKLRHVLDGP